MEIEDLAKSAQNSHLKNRDKSKETPIDTYKLLYPITGENGEKISKVNIYATKVKDQIKAEKAIGTSPTPQEKITAFIWGSTDLPSYNDMLEISNIDAGHMLNILTKKKLF